MSSSSADRVLDLLAAPEASFLDTGVSIVATVPRSERIAPDVTAIGGADAVGIVRAGGFIAAIESVASELAEGIVVEQEPAAGERLEREGVITLRLATPRLDPVELATENEGLASEQAARTAGPDDTEEWFRALAPSRPDASAGATSGKRHRKHRRPTPPARERFFDPPPAPSVGPSEPARTVPFLRRTRGQAGLWPGLTSSVCAVSPLLAVLQWRRASALLAGVLLVALLGTRLFASGDRRAQTAHPPAGKPVSARRPFARRRIRRSPEPRAGRSRMRNGARARKGNRATVALVAARPAHRADAGAPPATAPAPSATGQFAYLGQ